VGEIAIPSRTVRWILPAVLLAIMAIFAGRQLELLTLLFAVYVLPPLALVVAVAYRRFRTAGLFVFPGIFLVLTSTRHAWMGGGSFRAVAAVTAAFVSVAAVFAMLYWLARLYERRRINDVDLALDLQWLLLTLWQGFCLTVHLGRLSILSLAPFVVYKLCVLIGRRFSRSPPEANRQLLLLRTFGARHRSERLLDEVGVTWRWLGSIALIGAPDVAGSTIDAPKFLAFLTGKARDLFVQDDAALARRLGEVDLERDSSGRYRINELYCFDRIWREAVLRLARDCAVVLMDLRAFSAERAGCAEELQLLFDRVPLSRVVLLIDDTTRRDQLVQALETADRRRAEDSQNGTTNRSIDLVSVSSGQPGASRPLVERLCAAASETAIRPFRDGSTHELGTAEKAIRRLWTCLVGVVFFSLALLWAITSKADGRWHGFYGDTPLDRTTNETAPDVRAILQEELFAALLPEEREKLAGIRIEFPREDSSHVLNFSSVSAEKVIRMPIASLRFLRDMAAAYAWLSVKGYDLQPVTDYLCLIKYQWLDGLQTVRHTPLEVLGVPQNALDDPAVMSRFQRLYGSMLVFALGHELGHIYRGHKDAQELSPEDATRQEAEADAFALEIIIRMGQTPVGIPLYFRILAHLEPFAGDRRFREDRPNRSHPLNAQRIQALVDDIARKKERFMQSRALSAIALFAPDLRQVADILGNGNTQETLRRIGLSSAWETLQPRRLGELPRLPGEGAGPLGKYSGIFVGKWFDAKGSDMEVKMVLTRKGEVVEGSYTLFTVIGGKRHTHGSSSITLTGKVSLGMLQYEWHWGNDYFGRGELRASADGEALSGTWGYNKASDGAGTWQLRRAKE
ncbi:MAG: hypothetical protein WBL40_14555, partial [Terrimicrobiaceae bacterium]